MQHTFRMLDLYPTSVFHPSHLYFVFYIKHSLNGTWLRLFPILLITWSPLGPSTMDDVNNQNYVLNGWFQELTPYFLFCLSTKKVNQPCHLAVMYAIFIIQTIKLPVTPLWWQCQLSKMYMLGPKKQNKTELSTALFVSRSLISHNTFSPFYKVS